MKSDIKVEVGESVNIFKKWVNVKKKNKKK